MKNKDRFTIIVFILLIVMMVGLFIYHIYENNLKNDVNRKVEYIFHDYTYQMIYSKGCELFDKSINLLINKDVLEFEKNLNGKYAYYSVDNCNNCKKIVNAVSFTNILSDSEINKYMVSNNIIKYENLYYIKDNIDYEYNKNYIGSIIDIDSYDDKYTYFKSINYYCDNSVKYLGILDEEPDCNYTKKVTSFKIKLENKNIRLDNLESLKDIVK